MNRKELNDGGPAFPQSLSAEGPFGGLTIRDWFAGRALASGMAPYNYHEHRNIAEWCGKQADAMLAEREKAK